MKNHTTTSNSEQLDNKSFLKISTSGRVSSSINRINLGIKFNDSIKYPLKPQSTSIPKRVADIVHKPPIETVKLSDYLPKKQILRFYIERRQFRKEKVSN